VNHYAPLLRDAGFRAIWGAAAVSGLGDRIAAIALYLLIFRQTGSPVDLGILAATQIVPAILLGPVTGLVCDRLDRKGIMITSDLVSALVVAAIPLVHTSGQVYLLAAALGCGRQFSGPARLALLPDVLPQAQLGAANSLLMLTRNVVLLVGPALGAALVAWKGTDPAFWFDAATFVASAAILVAWRGRELAHRLPVRDSDSAGATLRSRVRRLREDLVVGLRGVLEHPGLRLAFGFFAVLTFVTAMQQPLVVVFVKDVLAGSDVQLGLIISAAGLGGILGALGGGLVVGRRRPLQVIALLTALDGDPARGLRAQPLLRRRAAGLRRLRGAGDPGADRPGNLLASHRSGGSTRPHLRLAGHGDRPPVAGLGLPRSAAGDPGRRGDGAAALRAHGAGHGAAGRAGAGRDRTAQGQAGGRQFLTTWVCILP
jgi:hypothetical protein